MLKLEHKVYITNVFGEQMNIFLKIPKILSKLTTSFTSKIANFKVNGHHLTFRLYTIL